MITGTSTAQVFCKHMVKWVKQREQIGHLQKQIQVCTNWSKEMWISFPLFLFTSFSLPLCPIVTAVQFIFMLKSLMPHDCSRTDLDARRNECWNLMSFLNKWWIGSMVKFEMRDLQRANILNNKLLLICFLPDYHFNPERIQRFWTGSIESKKERMWSN